MYLNIIEAGFPGQVVYIKVKGKETSYWEEHRTVTETVTDDDS